MKINVFFSMIFWIILILTIGTAISYLSVIASDDSVDFIEHLLSKKNRILLISNIIVGAVVGWIKTKNNNKPPKQG